MAITINYPVDELMLDQLITSGYVSIKLYYANTPEGPFVDSGIAPLPNLLSTSNTAGPPHEFVFSFPAGNAAQWFKVVGFDGTSISSLNDAQAFHGGGGTTLQVIRQKLGKLTHNMQVGTTSSAGAGDGSTAIVDSADFKRRRDAFFGGGQGVDGWFFHRLDTNEWTVVSNWVQSTGTFTFSPQFSTQVPTDTKFEVVNRWTPDELRESINWAIENSYPILSKPVIDTGSVTVEDVYSYQVPNNIRILNKIEIESGDYDTSPDDRTRGHPWRQVAYEEIDDGLTRKVEFKRELKEDRRIRFTGTSVLNLLFDDSDYVEVVGPQVDLITYYAAYRLYSLLTNTDAASDIDRARMLAQTYLAMYEDSKRIRASRRKPKKIWSHDALWSIR